MIQGMSHFLALPLAWEQVVSEITRLLSGAGLQVVRSFELHSTRAARLGYTCPYHGAEGCNCQLIVLLVYGQDRSPISLVIQGRDQQTWVSVVNRPGQRVEARQETAILRALSPGILTLMSQGETPGIA